MNENKMQQFSRLTNIKKTILWSLSIFDQYSYINWKGSGYSTVLFLDHKISSSNRTHHHSSKGFKARTGYAALGVFGLFTCNRLTILMTCWIFSHGEGCPQLFFTFLSRSSTFTTFIRTFSSIFCQIWMKLARNSKTVL